MDAVARPFVFTSARFTTLYSSLRTPHLALPFVLILGLTVRLWVVSHSQMAARDSIGFIRYSLNLEMPPPGTTRLDVIKRELHPPGYPLAVLAMSWPVRAVMEDTSCDAMVRAAQLANVLAAVLLALPMYLLGLRLFGPGIALLATVMFQVLPVCVQITSDGLSDGLFLFAAAMTLWLAVRSFECLSPGRFLLCGLCSGLAYLVRPEGLMLAAAIGLVILLGKRFGGCSRAGYVLRNGMALIAGTLVVAAPYMLTIRGISNKTTTNGMFDALRGRDPGKILQSRPVETSARGMLFAVWWNDGINKDDSRALWATRSFLSEATKTFNYIGLPLALLGLWLLRKRIIREPGLALLVMLIGMQSAVLWLMAAKIGYVSQRHTLLIVMASCFFAAAAVPYVGRWLANRWKDAANAHAWSLAIAGVLIIACLPAGMKPMHTNRAGHREAGIWLAKHAQPGEQIVDPFRWAEFYAGRTLRSVEPPNVHAGNVYAVVEPNSPSPHSRLPLLPQAQYFAERGDLVYHWPVDKPADQAKVAIYRTPPLPFPVPEDFPR